MRFLALALTALLPIFGPQPLFAQQAATDPNIALLYDDQARCSSPESPDFSGEWCKGFRTGMAFLTLTNACLALPTGPLLDATSLPGELLDDTVRDYIGPDNSIIFESP